MIRPLTCLCLGAALLSGLYLYAEKHRAELLDRRIAAVMLKTEQATARMTQLDTEWAMLNQPERLQDMAGKYLIQLKPMAPAQFVQLSDLAGHLPAVEAPKPAGSTDDDAQVPVAEQPAPEEAAPAPVLAAVPSVPKQAAHAPAKMLARLDTRPRHVATADLVPHPLAHGMMLPLASPQPMGARVMSAMARPTHGPLPVVVSATPSYTPPAYIGSAIATGRSALPPPVPLGAGGQ